MIKMKMRRMLRRRIMMVMAVTSFFEEDSLSEMEG